MRILARVALAAALLAVPAAPAHADPVDDAIGVVHYVLCPDPEVDLCATYPGLTFLLCPVLGSNAPGVPGVVDIEGDGDTSVAGHPVWYCPPWD